MMQVIEDFRHVVQLSLPNNDWGASSCLRRRTRNSKPESLWSCRLATCFCSGSSNFKPLTNYWALKPVFVRSELLAVLQHHFSHGGKSEWEVRKCQCGRRRWKWEEWDGKAGSMKMQTSCRQDGRQGKVSGLQFTSSNFSDWRDASSSLFSDCLHWAWWGFPFLLFSLRAPNDCFFLISTHIILHVHVITTYFPFCAYF